MSAVLKMSVLARLNIEGIIRQQRSSDDETLMVNYELMKKLRIPPDERQIYMREIQTPNGPATELYPKTIRAASDLDVELESAEVRRLEALLKEWRNFTTDDVEWLADLKEQLKAVSNGVSAPTKLKKIKEAGN